MSERTERATLNGLIVICRDAERGFTLAAEHVKDAGLRTLLSELAAERGQYATALLPHATRLGGEGEGDGSRLATLHRAWIAIKDRVLHDDHAVLAEAERGEKAALATYDDALNDLLPPEARDLVESQAAGIRAALERLRGVHATSS
jgi:uncharacterized protein (TIGR02284 family)